MRVLHVIASSQRRGAEIFASDLIGALHDLGAEQQVAIIHGAQGDHIRFQAPVDVVGNGSGSSSDRPFDLRPSANLRRLARRWRPQVIQAHGGEALKVSAFAGLDPPLVYRRIGCAPSTLSRPWRRLASRLMMSRSDMVVAVAEAVRHESIRLFGIAPNRIMTIPNAIDIDRLFPNSDRETTRDRLGIGRDSIIVLSIGALRWEKDPLAHARIGGKVLNAVPNAVHVFVGDGPMRRQVEQEVSAIGLASRTRFLGIRSDVPDLAAAADALLFASRPDGMEGMPAVLIEAGMLGLPVAAYDVAGVSEVVSDGETGRLIGWGREQELGDALIALLSNPALGAAMGNAARARCLSHFDIRSIAPRYAAVYEGLVER